MGGVMAAQRLLSLDVMRGLTVIGMVVVNSAAVFSGGGERPVYGALLHATWHGATVADLIFPFFIFIVGMSIPFALESAKEKTGLTAALVGRLLWRGTLLFLIGLALAWYSFDMDGERAFRIPGVLQRIGVVFVVSALIFMSTTRRVQAAISVLLLLAYWPLLYVPYPHGAVDLAIAGQSFVQWFDRAVLGQHIYQQFAEYPYDPEGILSTLPAIAQALLGALLTQFIQQADRRKLIRQMCMAGAAMALLGWLWSYALPFNKTLWSGSFVLWTSGLAVLLFALLYYLLDDKNLGALWAMPCRAFGINAISGYVFHAVILGLVWHSPFGSDLYAVVLPYMAPQVALLFPITANVILTWAPLAVLQHKNIIIKV